MGFSVVFLVRSAVGSTCVLELSLCIVPPAAQTLLSDLGFVSFLKKGTQELLKYLRSKIQGMLLSSAAF